MLANHYLLSWESVSKPPSLEPIVITKKVKKEFGIWVTFTHVEGDLQDGAPLCNILTEKEADLIRKTWAYIYRLREEAKRLNKEAKGLFIETIENLEDPEREIE
jgi:hypothetical protein